MSRPAGRDQPSRECLLKSGFDDGKPAGIGRAEFLPKIFCYGDIAQRCYVIWSFGCFHLVWLRVGGFWRRATVTIRRRIALMRSALATPWVSRIRRAASSQ